MGKYKSNGLDRNGEDGAGALQSDRLRHSESGPSAREPAGGEGKGGTGMVGEMACPPQSTDKRQVRGGTMAWSLPDSIPDTERK